MFPWQPTRPTMTLSAPAPEPGSPCPGMGGTPPGFFRQCQREPASRGKAPPSLLLARENLWGQRCPHPLITGGSVPQARQPPGLARQPATTHCTCREAPWGRGLELTHREAPTSLAVPLQKGGQVPGLHLGQHLPQRDSNHHHTVVPSPSPVGKPCLASAASSRWPPRGRPPPLQLSCISIPPPPRLAPDFPLQGWPGSWGHQSLQQAGFLSQAGQEKGENLHSPSSRVKGRSHLTQGTPDCQWEMLLGDIPPPKAWGGQQGPHTPFGDIFPSSITAAGQTCLTSN